jgi:hypothetical protein
MPVQLKVKPRDIERLQAYLRSVPRGALKVALAAFSEYMLGKLRHYPPYRYVSRKAAYGKTFVSDRQRRYVMAKIREGRIDPGYPHRTGRLQRGWEVKGEPYRTRIENKTPYAGFVMGDDAQSAHERKVGWRVVGVIVASNVKGGMVKARAAVRKFIQSRRRA